MGSIFNDWKHLCKAETFQKSFLKTLCYNNKFTSKVKDFPNSLIKKFTQAFNLIKVTKTNLSNSYYNQTSHIPSPDMFTDWFKKYSYRQPYTFYLV